MSDAKILGQKIQSLCETKKITLDELAERCSITPQMIGKILEGQYIPSIGMLVRISRCLGERLGSLMDDQVHLGPVVHRKNESDQALGFTDKEKPVHSDMDAFPIAASKSGRHMEPFIIEMKPSSGEEIRLSNHEGEEFIYVLSGAVEIFYGSDTYVITEGDSIYYDSIIDHNVHSLGEKEARVLAVLYAPY
ncbi:MAG: helix-turn-helix domain-containing protein [Bacteroidota bacterium]